MLPVALVSLLTEIRSFSRGAVCALPLLAPALAAAQGSGQGGGVLAECMALSPRDDDIHACLDNYLDVLDDNLLDLSSFIRGEFGAESRAAFDRSQAAFESFRRENCLWYLQISSPRSAAEQIAKNCLAQLSVDRLAELQRLLAQDDESTRVIDGFYVYGANRNTFRPCGSDGRYLVAGNANAVSELQGRYISLASIDLQVLFTRITGELDEATDGGAGHDGVINISSVRDLRFPSESDCSLPTGSPQVAAVSASDAVSKTSVEQRVADVEPVAQDALGGSESALASIEAAVAAAVESPASTSPVADPSPLVLPSTEPVRSTASAASTSNLAAASGQDEALTAYFGSWLADCSSNGETRRCLLAVDMTNGDLIPTLTLERRANGRTNIELGLPGREVQSEEQIVWAIDGFVLRQLPGSDLRIGSGLSVQRVTERHFVDNELLPLMKRGSELRIELDGAVDGGAAQYRGTLIGLSRAMNFADDFLGL